jgi:hypothetical protein
LHFVRGPTWTHDEITGGYFALYFSSQPLLLEQQH